MTDTEIEYHFNDCVLDTALGELRIDGEVQPIEPQVFDLLLFLIRNRSRLVSYDELIAAIWDGRIISDSSIAARISRARKAVLDSGRQQNVIKTVARKGLRFVAPIEEIKKTDSADLDAVEATARPKEPKASDFQTVRFCRSADGTRIAFAQSGKGKPLVRAGHWLTHLEHDWRSPIWQPVLQRLGADFTVTRYDQRGNGLSDWNVSDFSLDRFVDDLEAVVDCADLDSFVLYGTSQGVPIALAYAARHPDRVSHLVLHGGYVQGRLLRADASEQAQAQAILTLMSHGWGKAGSAFLKSFTTLFIPDGTPEQRDSLVELQAMTTSAENAVEIRRSIDQFDANHFLKNITVKTLIAHAQYDAVQPLEQSIAIANAIKHSEFIMLDSANHILIEQDKAFERFFQSLLYFVDH